MLTPAYYSVGPEYLQISTTSLQPYPTPGGYHLYLNHALRIILQRAHSSQKQMYHTCLHPSLNSPTMLRINPNPLVTKNPHLLPLQSAFPPRTSGFRQTSSLCVFGPVQFSLLELFQPLIGLPCPILRSQLRINFPEQPSLCCTSLWPMAQPLLPLSQHASCLFSYWQHQGELPSMYVLGTYASSVLSSHISDWMVTRRKLIYS